MSKEKGKVTDVEYEEVEVLESEVAEENAKKADKKKPLTKDRVIHGFKKAGGYVLAAVGGFLGAVAVGMVLSRDNDDDDGVTYYLDDGDEDPSEEEDE